MILYFVFGNGLIDDVIFIGWTDSDFRISSALVWTMFVCMWPQPSPILTCSSYPCDNVLRRAILSGVGEVPALDHAVLTAQVAVDVDVVDERRNPGEGMQVRAAQVAG